MTRQGAPERRADLETRLHYALDQEDTAAFEAALVDAGDCGPTELAGQAARGREGEPAGYVIACRAAEDGNVAMLRAVYRTTGAVRAGRATPLDAAARNGRIAAVRELLRHHRPTAVTLAAAVGKGPRAVKTTDILCEAALEGNEVDIDLPAKTAIRADAAECLRLHLSMADYAWTCDGEAAELAARHAGADTADALIARERRIPKTTAALEALAANPDGRAVEKLLGAMTPPPTTEDRRRVRATRSY